MLKATPQVNEAMGKKIKEFFSVRPAAIDPEILLAEAQAAADKGTESLKTWWTTAGAAKQKILAPQQAALKERAAKNDKPAKAEEEEGIPL